MGEAQDLPNMPLNHQLVGVALFEAQFACPILVGGKADDEITRNSQKYDLLRINVVGRIFRRINCSGRQHSVTSRLH